MGRQDYSQCCFGWWIAGLREEGGGRGEWGGVFSLGIPPTFREQTVLKYLRPDSIYLAEHCCPPSLPPCQPPSFIRRSQPLLCADGAQFPWLCMQPGFLLYISTVLHSDSSASSALPFEVLCLETCCFGGQPPVMSQRAVGCRRTVATKLPNQVFATPI